MDWYFVNGKRVELLHSDVDDPHKTWVVDVETGIEDIVDSTEIKRGWRRCPMDVPSTDLFGQPVLYKATNESMAKAPKVDGWECRWVNVNYDREPLKVWTYRPVAA